MSTLLVIPIRNNLQRIEPLLKYLQIIQNKEIGETLFILEGFINNGTSTIEYLAEKYQINNYSINESASLSRSISFNISVKHAKQQNQKFLMIMNEGWEDNIHEFINFIKNNEQNGYDAIIGRRTPKEYSLGSLYNTLSNTFASLILYFPIPETKCDSINVFRVCALPNLDLITKNEGLFFFQVVHNLIKNKNVKFSDLDFGLNYSSFVKLNTKRFFRLIFYLLFSRFS